MEHNVKFKGRAI